MTDAGLVVFALLIGMGVAAIFWRAPLNAQLKALGIGLVLSVAMVLVLVSFSRNGGGLIDVLVNPPAWKLLALVASIVGVLVAIVAGALRRPRRK